MSIAVNARKITPSTAQKHPDVGTCIRYKCDRDSLARIMEERVPKECIYDPEAHLNAGDQVRGKTILVYEASRRLLLREKLSGYSGTHSNGYLETKNKTYAQLTEPFKNLVNSAANQQAALNIRQQRALLAAPEETNKRRKGKPRHQKPEEISDDIEDVEADLSDNE